VFKLSLSDRYGPDCGYLYVCDIRDRDDILLMIQSLPVISGP
jgi:hypothetical protein